MFPGRSNASLCVLVDKKKKKKKKKKQNNNRAEAPKSAKPSISKRDPCTHFLRGLRASRGGF